MNNILNKNKEPFIKESRDILYAGLLHLYCQIDATGSRENGINQFTQIICNELFSFFTTFKSKSRLNVLAALQGISHEDLKFCNNEESTRIMRLLKVPEKYAVVFSKLSSQKTIFNSKSLEDFIKKNNHGLCKHKNILNKVKDALAIGYYHDQNILPIINILISDNAPEYELLAKKNHGLCWIHDNRHYKKIVPSSDILKKELDEFLVKYWDFYHKLLGYKINPSQELAVKLEKDFDDLFTTQTHYNLLNDRIEKTFANKNELLLVLKHPEIPLHNNMAELGARAKVRKSDNCFHTMSKSGTQIQDAFLSIIQTAKKLNVNAYKYISDRLNNSFEMTSLADLILAKIDSS